MPIYKKIFVTFILFFVFESSAFSEMVKKVEVNGNQRISTETIIIFGDITVDKDYSPNDINILIKKLYDTTFFSNISVSLEN